MKRHTGESIRIFKNPILESFTHVHPIIPLLLWSPVVVWFFYRAVNAQGLTLNEVLLSALFGLVLWTFTEYTLHRYVSLEC